MEKKLLFFFYMFWPQGAAALHNLILNKTENIHVC